MVIFFSIAMFDPRDPAAEIESQFPVKPCFFTATSNRISHYVPSGYLLHSHGMPWTDQPFLIGKPSISMGHLYHGYVK
jgi:hypothetical protein